MTARRIPPSEWARHEPQIKHLYLDRGLPVKSKTGKVDLVGTMREEFGFSATPAQYETWINQQGLSKNFGKSETRLVIGILDQLQAQGFKARALDSGKEIMVDKLKRKRRYAVKSASGCSGPVTTQQLPPRITIEIFDAVIDKWISYQSPLSPRGDRSTSDSSVIAPVARRSASPRLSLPFMSSSSLLSWMEISSPGAMTSLLNATGCESWDMGSSSTSSFAGLDTLGAVYMPPLQFGPPLLTPYQTLPFYQVVQMLRQGHHQITGYGTRNGAASVTTRQTSQALTLASATSMVGSLLHHAQHLVADLEKDPRGSPNPLPAPEEILDRLLSLLPEDDQQDMAAQSTEVLAGHDVLDSVFHKTLLYSIVNGFAGLQDLPRGAVLRMLRGDQHVSRRLFELVQRCPPSLAKSFTENIFKAAIEGRDARAVKLIADAVQGTPNAIKPDEVVCELDGNKYTPLELAAHFRDLVMIQTVLDLGADVNKTRMYAIRGEVGALEHAVRFEMGRPALDMRIPRVLLAAGAEVRVRLVEAVVKQHGVQPELHRELLGRLLPDDHREHLVLLPDFAQHLENALAHETIQWVLRQCVAASCRHWTIINLREKLLKRTLAFAARRGNTPLCNFLLGYTRAGDDALAAAISSGEQEVIALLLKHGAFRMEDASDGTTPFAEAIRRQDDDLLQELESREAWSQLHRRDHFEAAARAAAEVGNLDLLDRVLKAAPRHYERHLAIPLNMAIEKGHTQAALMLLNAGACTKERWTHRYNALIPAIRRQNAPLVDVLLESDVEVNSKDGNADRTVLDYAVEWGNLPVIEALIFMGADIDRGALRRAVGSGNTTLVARLLDFGANPNRLSVERHDDRSPLEVAMKNEDTEMMHLLLSRGASPADQRALVAVVKASNSILGTLLEAFKDQHPNGLGGFGGEVVIEAIEANNEGLLRDLISAKMNVVSFCHFKDCTPLATAIRHGHKHMVDMLLDACAHVNGMAAAPLGFGGGYIKSDAWPRMSPLLVAIETRSEDMVRLLIARGASVDTPARKGFKRTPLQKACEMGSFKMVKLLLDYGADVNSPPAVRGGGTALQLAAATGSIKIASYLLEHGALVHAPAGEINGRTALEAAAEKGRIDMTKLLWDAAYPAGYSADQVQNALDFATKEGHVSCADYIRFLADTSADPTGRMPSSQVMSGGPWTGWN